MDIGLVRRSTSLTQHFGRHGVHWNGRHAVLLGDCCRGTLYFCPLDSENRTQECFPEREAYFIYIFDRAAGIRPCESSGTNLLKGSYSLAVGAAEKVAVS